MFFRQQRFGFNNNLIGVYKFRSMYADKADNEARKQVTRNDPRVTPLAASSGAPRSMNSPTLQRSAR